MCSGHCCAITDVGSPILQSMRRRLDNIIEIPNAPAGTGPRAGRAAGGLSASDAQTVPDAVRRAAARAGDLARCAAESDGAKPAAMAAATPISADRRPDRYSHNTTTSPAARPNFTLQPASVLPRQPLRNVWDTLAIDIKLAIIRLVVDRVRVFPGQSGAKWRQWRFDTSKVEIDWKVTPPPAQ
jgi:hypothetical protein